METSILGDSKYFQFRTGQSPIQFRHRPVRSHVREAGFDGADLITIDPISSVEQALDDALVGDPTGPVVLGSVVDVDATDTPAQTLAHLHRPHHTNLAPPIRHRAANCSRPELAPVKVGGGMNGVPYAVWLETKRGSRRH